MELEVGSVFLWSWRLVLCFYGVGGWFCISMELELGMCLYTYIIMELEVGDCLYDCLMSYLR